MGVTEMWLLLLVLFGLGNCFFIALIFSMLASGRRADEREEAILGIILPTLDDTATMQKQHAPWPASGVLVGKD
jgi:hypothetical protein